jgi:hypothetical protein
MSCKKSILKNTSNTFTSVINYTRCSDNLTINNYQINPNETVNIWYVNDSYYTASNTIETIETISWPPVTVTPSTSSVTPTPTPTHSVTPTNTTTLTPTPSVTPTNTTTLTQTPSVTPTNTTTLTQTNTPTATAGETPTPTPSVTPTNTPTTTAGETPTPTNTTTLTPTNTPTSTAGETPTPTPTPTETEVLTPTPTPTESETPTPTNTTTLTPTNTPTSTAGETPTPTPTPTETEVLTPTPTPTESETPTPTPTNTTTLTPTNTPTSTAGETPTPTNTNTLTPTPTPTSAATYDSTYQAVLDYADTQGYTLPSLSGQSLQNEIIVELKNNSIWDKLDLFYLFKTDGDNDFATLNWVDPSSYKITEVNSPTFTTNVGFMGNGTNAYLNTGWDATIGPNFIQTGATHGVYTSDAGRNRPATPSYITGSTGFHGGGGNPYNIINYFTGSSGQNGYYVNMSGASNYTPQNASFRAVSISGSTLQPYEVQFGIGFTALTPTTGVTTLSATTDPIYIMARGVPAPQWFAPSNVEFRADFWGGYLSQVEVETIYNALDAYNSAI